MRKIVYILISTLILIGSTYAGYRYLVPKEHLPTQLEESKNLLYKGEYDSAIYFAHKIIETSKDLTNIAYANNIIGYSWYEKSNFDSAFFYYAEAIRLKKNSTPNLNASAYNMMGLIFEKKQTHETAIKYFQEAIGIYESEHSKRLPIVYYNLAYNQSQVDNIECIKSYYKALEYASEFKDEKYESYCLGDLGNLMLETSNYEAASEYFIESLDNDYAQNNPMRKAFALQGLGESEFFLKDYANAKVHALETLKLKTENNIEEHLFSTYFLLGRIYKETEDLIEAENNYKRALIYYPFNERNKKAVNVFKELSDVQFQMGKFNQSEYHNQLHFEELERIFDERKEAHQLSQVAI